MGRAAAWQGCLGAPEQNTGEAAALTARPCGLDLRNLHPVIRVSGTRGPSLNNGLSSSEHGGRLSVRRLGKLIVCPEAGAMGRLPGLLPQGWACPLLQELPCGAGAELLRCQEGEGAPRRQEPVSWEALGAPGPWASSETELEGKGGERGWKGD